MCIRDVREQQAAFPGSYVVYEERGPETLWGYRFYIWRPHASVKFPLQCWFRGSNSPYEVVASYLILGEILRGKRKKILTKVNIIYDKTVQSK